MQDISLHSEKLLVCVGIITQVEEVIYQGWAQFLREGREACLKLMLFAVSNHSFSK